MHALALVVITHQSERWLPGLAASWCAHLNGAQVPVVIGDAGSGDGTAEAAEREFAGLARVRVLRLENRGFGATANAALREVDAEWAILCNADVTFSVDFVERAMQVVGAAGAEVVGIVPQLLNADGTAQASVGRFPTVGSVMRDQFRRPEERKYAVPQPAATGEIDWGSGACLLLRRQAFAAVGGFDERYFLYVEEVDLQRRLREAGGVMVFRPELRVTHHAPNASRVPRAQVQTYAARGMLRYFAKFGGGLWAYRWLAFLSGRLGLREAMASRRRILEQATGP